MGLRDEMVTRMKKLLGNSNFIYGGYESEPSVPYGNYARDDSSNFFSDDSVNSKINTYIIRVVTDNKDFELESKVEKIFDDLHITYEVINEENIKREKVLCVEWSVQFLE